MHSLYRPVEGTDIQYIAKRMRQADMDELRAAHGDGCSLLDILYRSVEITPNALTRTAEDGEPLLIVGAAPLPGETGHGIPWLLGTDRAMDYPRQFVTEGRRLAAGWLMRFTVLENYIDVRNSVSIRWLRHIGFTIHEAVPFGVSRLPFHRFSMDSGVLNPSPEL